MIKHILILILPLIVSNTLHMFVVKHDLFAFLKAPVSAAAFGANKTIRGFVVVPLLNGLGVLLISQLLELPSPVIHFVSGLLLGLAYLLSELPNSYIKRRLGVPAGGRPGRNRIMFALMDKCDSVAGVSLVYFFLYPVSLLQVMLLTGLSISAHFFFSWLLVMFHIKKSF